MSWLSEYDAGWERDPGAPVEYRRWIPVPCSVGNENWAKANRAKRDKQYGQLIKNRDESFCPWVGDLGELVFNNWLKHRRVTGYRWLLDEPLNNPDFIFASGVRVDIKAVKRAGPPRDGYTSQISAESKEENVDHFFFMTYEIARRIMWMLGGIEKERFLSLARFYGSNERVHAHYVVPDGHSIKNIENRVLDRPEPWLESVR